MFRLITSAMLLIVANFALAVTSSNFTVEGTITAASCKVSVDGGGAVELPKKPRKLLASAGDTTGKTGFKIELEKCPAGSKIYFQQDLGTVNSAGRLLNTSTAGAGYRAENVDLEMLNADGGSMNLAAGSGLQNGSSADSASTADNIIYSFFVQYYATGAATVGEVKSSITFIVESF